MPGMEGRIASEPPVTARLVPLNTEIDLTEAPISAWDDMYEGLKREGILREVDGIRLRYGIRKGREICVSLSEFGLTSEELNNPLFIGRRALQLLQGPGQPWEGSENSDVDRVRAWNDHNPDRKLARESLVAWLQYWNGVVYDTKELSILEAERAVIRETVKGNYEAGVVSQFHLTPEEKLHFSMFDITPVPETGNNVLSLRYTLKDRSWNLLFDISSCSTPVEVIQQLINQMYNQVAPRLMGALSCMEGLEKIKNTFVKEAEYERVSDWVMATNKKHIAAGEASNKTLLSFTDEDLLFMQALHIAHDPVEPAVLAVTIPLPLTRSLLKVDISGCQSFGEAIRTVWAVVEKNSLIVSACSEWLGQLERVWSDRLLVEDTSGGLEAEMLSNTLKNNVRITEIVRANGRTERKIVETDSGRIKLYRWLLVGLSWEGTNLVGYWIDEGREIQQRTVRKPLTQNALIAHLGDGKRFGLVIGSFGSEVLLDHPEVSDFLERSLVFGKDRDVRIKRKQLEHLVCDRGALDQQEARRAVVQRAATKVKVQGLKSGEFVYGTNGAINSLYITIDEAVAIVKEIDRLRRLSS